MMHLFFKLQRGFFWFCIEYVDGLFRGNWSSPEYVCLLQNVSEIVSLSNVVLILKLIKAYMYMSMFLFSFLFPNFKESHRLHLSSTSM
jgi:hypothetical protein